MLAGLRWRLARAGAALVGLGHHRDEQALALLGGLMLGQQIRLRRKGVRVMGTVTRIEEQTTTHLSADEIHRIGLAEVEHNPKNNRMRSR